MSCGVVLDVVMVVTNLVQAKFAVKLCRAYFSHELEAGKLDKLKYDAYLQELENLWKNQDYAGIQQFTDRFDPDPKLLD